MRAALGILLVAGCGSSGHPELHFDVRVSTSGVYVTAFEVARPDVTNQQPFAHPGECDRTSDAWSCEGPCPATWLGELRLEAGGELIADGAYDWPWGGGILADATGLDDASLVIEDAEGDEVRVPLPADPSPVPEITITLDGDDAVIAWTASPAAATAVIELGSGFGGPRCHTVDDELRFEDVASDSWDVHVRALRAPTTVATSWGVAEVWIGDAATASNPTP